MGLPGYWRDEGYPGGATRIDGLSIHIGLTKLGSIPGWEVNTPRPGYQDDVLASGFVGLSREEVTAQVDIDFPPPSWVKVELSAPAATRCRAVVNLEYETSVLIPGGERRDEPSTVKELVEEIDRQMNASHFGGRISPRLLSVAQRTA